MRRVLLMGMVVLLGVGGFLVWRQLFPGAEQQIRRQIGELQEVVSFRASDGNLALLADMRRLGSMFVENASVRVDVPGGLRGTLTGRDNIMQAAGAARQAVGALNVEFLDIVVTLAGDGRTAVVEATAKARQQGSQELWIQELRFHFVRTEDGWQIRSVETVRTLTAGERLVPC